MERLAVQSERCLRLLREDAEWQDKTQQLLDLQETISQLQASQTLGPMDVVVAQLKPLAPYLVALMGDIRSAVVKATCSAVAAIAIACGPELAPFVDEILIGILNTAYVKVRVFSSAGETCLETISRRSRYSMPLLHQHFQQTKHADVRHLCIAQFPIIMSSWLTPELDSQFNTMKSMLVKALVDNDDKVRRKAREAFCMFSDIWGDHMDEFVQIPLRATRESIIKEFPQSKLAKALRLAYGEPVTTRTPLKQRLATPTPSVASEDSDGMPSSPSKRSMSVPTMVRTPPPHPGGPLPVRVSRAASEPVSSAESTPAATPRPRARHWAATESVSSDDVAPIDLDDELARRDEAEREPSPLSSAEAAPEAFCDVLPAAPSLLQRATDSLLWACTSLSILFAAYGIAGALWSLVFLAPSSSISFELQEAEDAVAASLYGLRAHEASMTTWMQSIATSMEDYRRESSEELTRLKEANIVWNRSLREDMAAFTAEFVSKIRFDPSPAE
ncbi:hypothetical protein ACHHYP_14564 [Achlya hypogyna]|uniref:CLASP N-terminal domain-containing protein n=1 Tax=Achlya hypogyna TaxID=1202772 RepID=A0A1V9YD04_ACHHY|nr:hypothetical protein ACHHYP_14564 [Achlya hypogyna]